MPTLGCHLDSRLPHKADLEGRAQAEETVTPTAPTLRMLIHCAPCAFISRSSVVHSRLYVRPRGVSGYVWVASTLSSLVIHLRCTVP